MTCRHQGKEFGYRQCARVQQDDQPALAVGCKDVVRYSHVQGIAGCGKEAGLARAGRVGDIDDSHHVVGKIGEAPGDGDPDGEPIASSRAYLNRVCRIGDVNDPQPGVSAESDVGNPVPYGHIERVSARPK